MIDRQSGELGVAMATVEERLEALEERIESLEHLAQSAAGQLREVKHARSFDELKSTLVIVAGNLGAMGKGGNQTK